MASVDKSTLLKAFNGQIEEFLEDIVILFPENREIKTSKTAIVMMKQANPKMLLSVWYRYIYMKYAEKIEEENIDYFLNKDYTDDVAKLEKNNSGGSSVIESINKLKGPLRELDEENTSKCLQYLKNLNNLSNMYMNL
jgi:hypothetical protein